MQHTTKKFGQLPPRNLTTPKVNPIVKTVSHGSKQEKVDTTGERATAWASYFTMVYAAIISFMPETAAAAIVSAQNLIA